MIGRSAVASRAAVSTRLGQRPVVCRADGSPSSNGVAPTSTIDRPEATASQEDVKIKSTLDSLDALLGEQAKPKAPTKPSASSSSSNGASSSAPASKAGAFNSWPGVPSTSNSSTSSSASARKNTKDSQSFEKIMAFEGLAPEVINGRAAMLGFVFAITGELKSGESVFAQMVSGGAAEMLVVILAVTVASFAPLLRQIPAEEVFNKAPKKVKAFGPFAPDSELINGRAAMVGLAAMILLEGASGTAFFL